MSAVTKIDFTPVFEDETTAKITLDNIDPATMTPTAIENIRTTVQNFNNTQGGTLTTKMKSKNGFNWIGIKAVTITTTDKTVIF